METLTQGLSSATAKGLHSDWREIVFKRFWGDYASIAPSANTRRAELILAIAAPHAYWFLSKVDTLYGRVLMAWKTDLSSLPESCAVSPFDTGGLSFGHMQLIPTVATADRAGYLKSWSMSANQSRSVFGEWLKAVFVDPFEYVSGAAVPDWVVHEDVQLQAGLSLSWSWELRIPVDQPITGILELSAIFWTYQDLDNFRSFLRRRVAVKDLHQAASYLALVSVADPTVSLSMQRARAYVSEKTRGAFYD